MENFEKLPLKAFEPKYFCNKIEFVLSHSVHL